MLNLLPTSRSPLSGERRVPSGNDAGSPLVPPPPSATKLMAEDDGLCFLCLSVPPGLGVSQGRAPSSCILILTRSHGRLIIPRTRRE